MKERDLYLEEEEEVKERDPYLDEEQEVKEEVKEEVKPPSISAKRETVAEPVEKKAKKFPLSEDGEVPETTEVPKTPAAPAPDKTQDLIAGLLDTQDRMTNLLEKFTALKPPEISIAAPEIAFPPANPIKKWVFQHEYNQLGDCIRTTATAITHKEKI